MAKPFGRVSRVLRIARRHLLYRALVAATLINAALLIGAHISVNPTHTIIAGDSGEHYQTPKDPLIDRMLDDPVAVLTIFVVILTGALVYVTYRLVDSTVLLWQAGENQIAFLRISSERQLRAYVHVRKCDIQFVGFAERPAVAVIIQNYGATPAHSLNWTIKIEWENTSNEMYLEVPTARNGTTTLGPGGTVYKMRYWSDTIGNSAITSMKNGSAPLYVHGAVRYEDAFGHSCQTKFRLKYRGNRDGDGKPILEICEQGNEAT